MALVVLKRVRELIYRAEPRPMTVLWIFDMNDRLPFKKGVMELVSCPELTYCESFWTQRTVL